MREGETLVFVEVKLRKDRDDAPFAVDAAKQRRISRAAVVYLAEHGLLGRPARFDVVSVGFDGRAWTCATSKTPFRSRAEDILYDEDETMRRKIWICCLLLLLALALPLGAQAAENLVQNGDFSQWDESGLPVGWTYAAWTQDETVSTYWTEEVDGNRCVRLQNFSENDARLEQTVAVRGNTTYRISARMKAEGGDPERTGGNLSVSGSLAVSQDYADTDGQWVPVELYGKTGFFQGEITVALRVGFYGEENVGSAWFDDVVVEAVDEVPAGVTVQSLQDAPVSAAPDETEGADWIPMQTFVAAAFALLVCAFVYRLRGVEIEKARAGRLFGVILAAAARCASSLRP